LVQTYQNGENIPIDHKLYQTAISIPYGRKNIPNGHKNIPTLSIPTPSKIYPNWIFGMKIKHLATLE
jgi:hypothetical protein